MVGQHHGEDLHALQVVGVVAEDAGELDLADLVQLLQGEGGGPPAVFVPEAVAVAEIVELEGGEKSRIRILRALPEKKKQLQYVA